MGRVRDRGGRVPVNVVPMANAAPVARMSNADPAVPMGSAHLAVPKAGAVPKGTALFHHEEKTPGLSGERPVHKNRRRSSV